MNTTSRFSRVSRRAFVTGSASLAAIAGLSACADDSALTSESPATDTATTGGSSDTSAASSPAASASENSSSAPAESATGRLGVTFTVASGNRNPYVAVWVETTSGEFVQTVSLWHLTREEDRWLSDLKAWYQASGGAETNTGATRAGGTYTVEWDLTNASGTAVPAGDYVVYIEGVREHGEYELLESKITLGGNAASGTFTDVNDITDASWSYTP